MKQKRRAALEREALDYASRVNRESASKTSVARVAVVLIFGFLAVSGSFCLFKAFTESSFTTTDFVVLVGTVYAASVAFSSMKKLMLAKKAADAAITSR